MESPGVSKAPRAKAKGHFSVQSTHMGQTDKPNSTGFWTSEIRALVAMAFAGPFSSAARDREPHLGATRAPHRSVVEQLALLPIPGGQECGHARCLPPLPIFQYVLVGRQQPRSVVTSLPWWSKPADLASKNTSWVKQNMQLIRGSWRRI